MPTLNRVMVMGNLTRDPKLREFDSGTHMADIGLAISDSYKNKKGEAVDKTCFVDIVAWDKQAKVCGDFLKKGSSVMVEGELELNSYTNKEGVKVYKHRIRAARIHFMDPKPKN